MLRRPKLLTDYRYTYIHTYIHTAKKSLENLGLKEEYKNIFQPKLNVLEAIEIAQRVNCSATLHLLFHL